MKFDHEMSKKIFKIILYFTGTYEYQKSIDCLGFIKAYYI